MWGWDWGSGGLKIQHREELLLSLRQKRKRGDKKLQQLGENQACEKPCFKGARVVNSLDIQHEPALLVCHMGLGFFLSLSLLYPLPFPFFLRSAPPIEVLCGLHCIESSSAAFASWVLSASKVTARL